MVNPSMVSDSRARGRRLVAAMWGSRGGVARGGRKRGSRRSLWAGQRSEGEAVAAVVLVGGDGRARQGMGREPEGGEGHGESGENERGDEGECVALVDGVRASAEAGGGRRVAAGAGHAPLVLLARGGG